MRSPLITISMESTINKLSVSQQHNLITIPLDNRNVRIYDINGNRICRLSRDSHSRMVTCAAWLAPLSTSALEGAGGGPSTSGPSGSGGGGSSSSGPPNMSSISSPNSFSNNSGNNSLSLFTCAFDRRVCAWSIVTETK